MPQQSTHQQLTSPSRTDRDQNSRTYELAEEASSIELALRKIEKGCKHETICIKTKLIADECLNLYTTLHELDAAIKNEPDQYTSAFNQDLEEITTELHEVFAEIQQCADELAGSNCNASSASWFFNRGRVGRLLKHIETLKGTLIVMRLVLQHGKDYGTHTSDRLAESNPHTMHEDRVILEALFAQHKDAIIEMQNLANAYTASTKNTLERKPSKAGDHYRKLSEATGVEVPEIPDVLPPQGANPSNESWEDNGPSPTTINLKRTFSKRAHRLGVHKSILDLSANEAPAYLQQKWVLQARHMGHGCGRGLTALPELSRISEVDTSAGSTTNLHGPSYVAVEPAVSPIPESPAMQTPIRSREVLFNTPIQAESTGSTGCAESANNNQETMSSRIKKVISRLSLSNLRSPSRTRREARKSESSVEPKKPNDDESKTPDELMNNPASGPARTPLFSQIRQRLQSSTSPRKPSGLTSMKLW